MADPAAIFAKYRNSQTFTSRTISSMVYWPAAWCVSFKHTLIPRWPLNFFKAAAAPRRKRASSASPAFPNPDHARDGVCASKRNAWWKLIGGKDQRAAEHDLEARAPELGLHVAPSDPGDGEKLDDDDDDRERRRRRKCGIR